jgi:CBS domain-containing protein
MLSEAAERMKALDVDRLPVVENNEIIGAVTSGDIAAAIAAGRNLTTTPVKYALTPGVAEDRPADGLAQAAALAEDG